MKHSNPKMQPFFAIPPPVDVARRLGRQRDDAAYLPSVEALGLALLDANPDHIQLIDARGRVLWMNEAARSRPAFRPSKLGEPIEVTDYWPGLSAGQLATALAVSKDGEFSSLLTSIPTASGERWWDIRIGAIANAGDMVERRVLIARDVTAQRLAAAAAEHAASHDGLTGLASGDLFQRHIDSLVAAGNTAFCVLLVELDQLRYRNDMTVTSCDDTLRTVAMRLVQSVRKDEMAARLGDNTFGVILSTSNSDGPDDTRSRARMIVDRLAKSTGRSARRPGVPISAGLARCAAPRMPSGTTCRNAFHALQIAKTFGNGHVVEFNEPLQKAQATKDVMLARAECALAARSIIPFYQCKVDLTSGRIVGFEALLRWRSPLGKIEPPAAIAAAFDDPALSRRITEAMFGRVIHDLQRWQRRGDSLPVAINVVGADLRQPDFAERLIGRLANAGLPPSSIEIEITEMAVLGRNSEDIAAMLGKLRAAGIRIALDDFGTGYASLVHLKQLPVSVLKIDRSFVSNLGNDPGDCAIVEAILGMAQRLEIDVVAEGIETAAQARFLQTRGCKLGQGFLFGRAIPSDEVHRLLAAPVQDFSTEPEKRCEGCTR